MEAERDRYSVINFEETELRLGLPLSGNEAESTLKAFNGKRGFSDTRVDLKLNLSSTPNTPSSEVPQDRKINPTKPPAKAQVVGWPPVRSFRKNIVSGQRSNDNDDKSKEEAEKGGRTSKNVNVGGAFVKVSMDGAPYLRKVDLKLYKSYQDLCDALAKMFSSFTVHKSQATNTKDLLNETKLIDLLNTSDYVPTYEDKDGDWMLVGDVPWDMFVQSCKRLRIMKGSEAIGLAPRAVEKCKNRS